MSNIKLWFGDCLKLMQDIPDKSIDMIFADLPYGKIACKWDSIISFDKLWPIYNRIIKDNRAIVLTASQPFTSVAVMSNPKMFKYEWIWRKNTGSGFVIAKYQPLKYHESILIFSKGKTIYNPIPTERFSQASKNVSKKPIRGGGKDTQKHVYSGYIDIVNVQYDETKSPESVLDFKSVPNGGGHKLHPTQKPVELLEYLIRTYTDNGMLILDNVMGSGTTGEAAKKLERDFIGIENDKKYFEIAKNRIENY